MPAEGLTQEGADEGHRQRSNLVCGDWKKTDGCGGGEATLRPPSICNQIHRTGRKRWFQWRYHEFRLELQSITY